MPSFDSQHFNIAFDIGYGVPEAGPVNPTLQAQVYQFRPLKRRRSQDWFINRNYETLHKFTIFLNKKLEQEQNGKS